MNLTPTAVLTVAFVLRLKPQGEGVMQILFPKLKLGANYFIRPSDVVPLRQESSACTHPHTFLPLHIEH